MEAVYIMHIREFINSNQDIYKIGRTSQERTKRADSYPKGSYLLYHTRVKDSCDIENQIMACFKETFIHRREFGSEYFEGDYEEMRDAIYDIVKIDERKRKEKVVEIDDADAEVADVDADAVEVEVDEVEVDADAVEVELSVEDAEVDEIQKTKKTTPSRPFRITTNKTCLKCDRIFTTIANLKIHMNRRISCIFEPDSIPNKNYKFKCHRCKQTYQTRQNLNSHLSRKTPCKVQFDSDRIKLNLLFEQYSGLTSTDEPS